LADISPFYVMIDNAKTNLLILGEELCIFGVPLEVAVERQRCHDGVPLPMVRFHEFSLLTN
jgi:hypothetical protein